MQAFYKNFMYKLYKCANLTKIFAMIYIYYAQKFIFYSLTCK